MGDAVKIIGLLREKGYTLATAESCTGGLIASAFVDIPGASDVYRGGIVSYNEELKESLLGVKRETVDRYTVVSSQTAEEMCKGAAEKCGADIGLSSTGCAGPDGGTEKNPAGTVYIGVYIGGKSYVKRLSLKGERNEIRRSAVKEILSMLTELLTNEK